LPEGRPVGVKVNVPSVSPVPRVRMDTSEPESGPERRSTLTGPTASIQVRVKGWPSVRLKLRLVMAGFARPRAAKPARRAAENFFVIGV